MQRRINWLSILQGWAILLVVIGHAPLDNVQAQMPTIVDALYKIAYSFHMPLFAVISGYLFYFSRMADGQASKWTYDRMLKEKAKRLLIPSLFFSFLAFVMKMLFPSDMDRPVTLSCKSVLEIFLFPGRGPLSEVWFVVSLMWFFVAMPIWKWMLKSFVRNSIVLSVLIVTLFVPLKFDLLCIGDSLSLMFYFALGITFANKSNELTINYKWIIAGLVALALYIPSLMFQIPFAKSIFGIVISLVLALCLDKYIPSSFKSFRDYYFQIFLMGIFVQILVKMIYHNYEIPYWIAYSLCIIAGLYVPVLISVILKKWAPPAICQLFGIKK